MQQLFYSFCLKEPIIFECQLKVKKQAFLKQKHKKALPPDNYLIQYVSM